MEQQYQQHLASWAYKVGDVTEDIKESVRLLEAMDRGSSNVKDGLENHSLFGKEFYVICPDNENYFRTVFFRKNPFTGALQTMLSNPVFGSVPEGIPEMPANLLSRLNCMNTAMPHTI